VLLLCLGGGNGDCFVGGVDIDLKGDKSGILI
jgi:hypothetical protein